MSTGSREISTQYVHVVFYDCGVRRQIEQPQYEWDIHRHFTDASASFRREPLQVVGAKLERAMHPTNRRVNRHAMPDEMHRSRGLRVAADR